MTDRRRNDDAQSPLILGVILLVIGAGLLAAYFGFSVPLHLWRYWPFVLVVPGLIGTFFPSRHLTRPGGVWLLATGIYGIFGMYRPFDLGWAGAWPIFLIAAGFSVIFDGRRRGGHRQDGRDHMSESGSGESAASITDRATHDE